jgi:diphthine methyl ester acylhydrolase
VCLGDPLILTALSTGHLGLHVLHQQSEPTVEEILLLQLEEDDVLILSLTLHPTDPHLVGYTTSTGAVCLAHLMPPNNNGNPNWKVEKLETLLEHELEAFTMKFVHSSDGTVPPIQVLSGGDDAVMACSSLPGHGSNKITTPVDAEDDLDELAGKQGWKDVRTHGAGVTSILQLTPDLVLTGSYDDTIRLISLPMPGPYGEMDQPPRRRLNVVEELGLGGGVWCLRFVSYESNGQGTKSEHWVVLACCMYVGARLLKVSRTENTYAIEVLAEVTVHESMCYASDVVPSVSADKSRWFISSSFYDRRVCLWSSDTS